MSMPVSTCSGELFDFKSLFLMCFEKNTNEFFFPAHVRIRQKNANKILGLATIAHK